MLFEDQDATPAFKQFAHRAGPDISTAWALMRTQLMLLQGMISSLHVSCASVISYKCRVISSNPTEG